MVTPNGRNGKFPRRFFYEKKTTQGFNKIKGVKIKGERIKGVRS
jgi:hypothetical protein